VGIAKIVAAVLTGIQEWKEVICSFVFVMKEKRIRSLER
jgi:hypothetical protein